MNNRIPLFALGTLVLLAVLWRLMSPPAPVPPGPLGNMPSWYSGGKIGDMGPSAVNPSGTIWAGAWNQKTKDGKLRSAVWTVDFEKETAATCLLDDGSYSSSMTWADDNTIELLALNTMKPEDASKSAIISVDAKTGEKKATRELKTPVARIMDWGKNEMLAELAGDKAGQVAVISPDGEVRGKAVSVNEGEDVRFGDAAAVSGDTFVFSQATSETGDPVFYLGDAQTGEAKPIFSIMDLPGRVQEILLNEGAKEHIGVVVYNSKKYDTLVYDCTAGKLIKSVDAATAKTWDTQPFGYTTYKGGFTYSPDKAKSSKLFDFSKLSRGRKYLINYIQDGRLYKRKDGSYTCVSRVSDLVDIRVINKDGTLRKDLLPRR